MTTSTDALAALRDPAADPAAVHDAVTALLAADPVVGVAAVFDLLATEPRVKPSRGLVIDPADGVRRRWECRVVAAAALLDSPHAARVADELADEIGHDPVFARDVDVARSAAAQNAPRIVPPSTRIVAPLT